MAPIITDPKKLSMPQQVQKNKDDIAEIKKVIDGLDSLDNVVIVPDISHIMTAKELESVRQPVCFIVYDNHLYIKKKEESETAYFEVVFSIVNTTVVSFQSSQIEVNLSNGALGIVNSTYNVYSTTQIDEKLSTLVSYAYLNTQMGYKANLSGANFTGKITAPEVLEINSGFSFIPNTVSNYTFEYLYAGVVKTGNKVTFVLKFNVTKIADGTGDYHPTIARWQIPSEIGAKLIPSTIGTYTNNLDIKSNSAMSDAFNSVAINTGVNKVSDTLIDMVAFQARNLLTAGTKYQIRYEATFLLSDNLAS